MPAVVQKTARKWVKSPPLVATYMVAIASTGSVGGGVKMSALLRGIDLGGWTCWWRLVGAKKTA